MKTAHAVIVENHVVFNFVKQCPAAVDALY
jgi:hypothetical protein